MGFEGVHTFGSTLNWDECSQANVPCIECVKSRRGVFSDGISKGINVSQPAFQAVPIELG